MCVSMRRILLIEIVSSITRARNGFGPLNELERGPRMKGDGMVRGVGDRQGFRKLAGNEEKREMKIGGWVSRQG